MSLLQGLFTNKLSSLKGKVEELYEKEIQATVQYIEEDTPKDENDPKVAQKAQEKVLEHVKELKSKTKYGVLRCDYEYVPTRGDPGVPSTFTYDGSPEPVILKVEGWTFEAAQKGVSDAGEYPASEFCLKHADQSEDSYWKGLWHALPNRSGYYQVKEKKSDGDFEEEDYTKGIVYRYEPAAIEQHMKQAIQTLDDNNVCAITADVGYSQSFQQVVIKYTNTPVILSSLQQLSLIGKMFNLEKDSKNKVLVMCANGESFGKVEDKLLPKDIPRDSIEVIGLRDTEFGKWVAYGYSFSRLKGDAVCTSETGTTNIENPDAKDTEASVEEALEVLSNVLDEYKRKVENEGGKVVCLVQECAELPAYTNGLRRRYNIPVYDTITAIEFAKMGRGFSGHSAYMM